MFPATPGRIAEDVRCRLDDPRGPPSAPGWSWSTFRWRREDSADMRKPCRWVWRDRLETASAANIHVLLTTGVPRPGLRLHRCAPGWWECPRRFRPAIGPLCLTCLCAVAPIGAVASGWRRSDGRRGVGRALRLPV